MCSWDIVHLRPITFKTLSLIFRLHTWNYPYPCSCHIAYLNLSLSLFLSYCIPETIPFPVLVILHTWNYSYPCSCHNTYLKLSLSLFLSYCIPETIPIPIPSIVILFWVPVPISVCISRISIKSSFKKHKKYSGNR